IWVAYNVKDPDFAKHMALRQRVNLAIMRAVRARGLAFAFPTQTLHMPDAVRKAIVSPDEAAEATGTKK
ncbi:MAG TPA: hypothetical protein VHN79_00085, partial [Lacunisphaera sp.]|nr:hypothetical protein [Lacunisphaera sp.]